MQKTSMSDESESPEPPEPPEPPLPGQEAAQPCHGMLADLMQRIRPILKAIAREHARSVPDCKEDESDIVQRSMVKAVERLHQFNGQTPGQWRAWLVSIVRNQAKDVRRYWSQERRAHRYEENDSQVVGTLVDKSPPPPESLDESENRERLDRAIATLSIQDQQLVRWRMYQFSTYREIASRLGVAEHTARRRCEAALGALRRAWADGELEGDFDGDLDRDLGDA